VLLPAGPQAGHILDLWRLTLAICTLVFAAVLAAPSCTRSGARHAPHTQQAPPCRAVARPSRACAAT
jgi:cytochrome c oxidase subunit 2